MGTKKEGAFVLLGCIIVTGVLTYLLTKAKYEKKPVPPKPEMDPEVKPEGQKKDEIPLQADDTQKPMDVTQYAQKYKNKHDALVREYKPSQGFDETKRDIIDEDIFDTNPEYEAVSYTLFMNGVLTDENDEVTDPDKTIGRDIIERFNELEHNDGVYVRNHELKMDFEILRVPRNYKDPGGADANRA